MKTSDEEVATRIIERLLKEGLLSEETLARLESKLITGECSPEDWKLTVEMDLSKGKEARDGEDR